MKKHHTHRLVHALHFAFSGGLVALCIMALVSVYVLGPGLVRRVSAGGYAAFSVESFWNTRIPRYSQMHASSGSIVQSVVSQAQSYGALADNVTEAAPVYEVDAGTPLTSFVGSDCGGGISPSVAASLQAVPLPFYALPSDGAKKRMMLYQASSDTVWEIEGAQKVGNQWFACSGGAIAGVSNADGRYSGVAGVTSSGLSMLGGQVSVADLRRGVIGHAIGLSLPQVGPNVWPATRGGGGGVPLGTRLLLDPSINVDTLGLPPVARMIAKTAQTYGFVVWDTSDQVRVLVEDAKSYTSHGVPSPYGAFGSLSLAGFPWASLRAVPGGYGQGGITPMITNFYISSSVVDAGEMPQVTWSAVDVDSCTIPGLTGSRPADGSMAVPTLSGETMYTLTCAGPGGSVTRKLSVGVTGLPENTRPSPLVSTTIATPIHGLARVIPEFDTEWAINTIYKVSYSERGVPLQATTEAPFLLDTRTLGDGPHILGVQIDFRDQHQEHRTVTVRVQNMPEAFIFGPLSATTPPNAAQTLLIVGGITAMMAAMAAGGWLGWRWLHPYAKPTHSWLISYR